MKIEIPTDGYNIILSDNDLNNPNFVEMWVEEVRDKFDESDKELETFLSYPFHYQIHTNLSNRSCHLQ